jgi:hypothetical protein
MQVKDRTPVGMSPVALGALVLGLVGLAAAYQMPPVGLAPAVTGLVLGLIDWVKAHIYRHAEPGLAMLATLVCVAALVANLVLSVSPS